LSREREERERGSLKHLSQKPTTNAAWRKGKEKKRGPAAPAGSMLKSRAAESRGKGRKKYSSAAKKEKEKGNGDAFFDRLLLQRLQMKEREKKKEGWRRLPDRA